MEDDVRCGECRSLMFKFRYTHNGDPKIEYRCPHPHGMTNRKDFTLMEPIDFGELDEERSAFKI
jgi:hypothetical protein